MSMEVDETRGDDQPRGVHDLRPGPGHDRDRADRDDPVSEDRHVSSKPGRPGAVDDPAALQDQVGLDWPRPPGLQPFLREPAANARASKLHFHATTRTPSSWDVHDQAR